MTTIRRLYLYIVAFVALGVTAFGTLNLLTAALEKLTGQVELHGDAEAVALALAMLVIGGPIWALHWFIAERAAGRNADDRTSPLRHLYLNLVLLISAAILYFNSLTAVEWLLGTRPLYEPVLPSVAGVIIWALVWAYHWWVLSRDGLAAHRRTLHRWYVYVTAGYGLVAATWGITSLLQIVLNWLYGTLFMPTLLQQSFWSDGVRSAIAGALLGTLWWAFHWLYAARGDDGSTLRQVYLYIIAVAWGLAAVLISLGALLYETLRFFLEFGRFNFATHFSFLPDTLPFLAVGLVVGGYHWAVLRVESAQSAAGDQRVHRAYRYLVTAFALATAVVGATILLDTVLGLLFGSSDMLNRGWADPLSLALALLLIGGPLWAYQWSQAQAEVQRGGVDERSALPRRLLLYGVLTLSILAILGNLVYVLFRIFEAILEGTLSPSLILEFRTQLAIVLVAVAVLVYYGRVLAADRRLGAEQGHKLKTVTVWLGPDASATLPALTRDLAGYRLQVWSGPPAVTLQAATLDQPGEIAKTIAALPTSQALVIVNGDQVQVYPVEPQR